MQREITRELVRRLLPGRMAESNKGSYGSVLAAAGSMAYRGAAALCTEGALRGGAGLVYLASVEPVIQLVLSRTPECCACGCRTAANGGIHPQDADALRRWFADRHAVLLAGPGLGESAAAVGKPLLGRNAPWAGAVLDADALNALAEMHHSLLPEGSYVISAYDNLIRNISEEEGHDWRLMSAIAYHESRFTPDITSRSGARGLMQIMPSVARQFDVPAAEITDPRTNIWLANKLMSKIMSSLRFPEGTPEKDRMSIILASYNSGIGHVNDARRLARLNGENPNSWEVVARYLTLKAEPEFYENEVVRCGRFTGSRQTLAYVNDVIGRYDRYCRIAGR